ncbi:MAG: type II toxin-antitoxin system prevent-host-death family antitoxin [Reyranella sp.]|nr:type II toxin-antitoxin system prevent-host-death family antitoxin [Reyranella sp.]
MSRQIITQGDKPAFVVIPIEEWRRIEATLEDRTDAVVAAILDGASPLKAQDD